jgi:hypothetical protein
LHFFIRLRVAALSVCQNRRKSPKWRNGMCGKPVLKQSRALPWRSTMMLRS